MVSDKRNVDSADESEFGLGVGMIDAGVRKDRALSTEQQLMEIYALPKTFDGAANGVDLGDQFTTPVPRLLPTETIADRKASGGDV